MPACSHCNAAAARFTCAACERVFYCNEKCQRAHYTVHRSKCTALTQQQQRIRGNDTLSGGDLVTHATTHVKLINALTSDPQLQALFSYARTEGDSHHIHALTDISARYAPRKWLGSGAYGFVLSANAMDGGEPVMPVALKFQLVSPEVANSGASAEREMRIQRFLTALLVENGHDTLTHVPIVKEYDHFYMKARVRDIVSLMPSAKKRANATEKLERLARAQFTAETESGRQALALPTDGVIDAAFHTLNDPDGAVFSVSVMQLAHGTAHNEFSDAAAFTDPARVAINCRLLAQVLASVHMLSETLAFTHFDLHLRNIALVDTAPESTHPITLRYGLATDAVLYIEPDEGYAPALADFGMSYLRFDDHTAGNHYVEAPLIRTVLHTDEAYESPYARVNRLHPIGRGSVHTYNPSFDMQSLALSLIQNAVEADALWNIDLSLLELIYNMLHKDVSADLSTAEERRRDYAVLMRSLSALSVLRIGVVNANGYYAPTTLKHARTMQTQIGTVAKRLAFYPFGHVLGRYPTARSVFQRTSWLRQMLLDSRNNASALTQDRHIVDMSVDVGDTGSDSLRPFFA